MPVKTDISAEIIALERAALDRWGKGDPQGYISTFAPEITYFDPITEKRIDGFSAMRDYLTPFTGKIHVDRYDMIDPRVQHHGETAILTFNLISYGNETVLARWNSTEVYALTEGHWKIIHSHWSFIKPELKNPSGE
jgi:hypothetical protein